MSESLPSWASALQNSYLAGEASLFLVHGNIRDLQPLVGDDGKVSWVDLRTFLIRTMFRKKEVAATFDLSRGLRIDDKAQERKLRSVLDIHRLNENQPALENLPFSVAESLPIIEAMITLPSLRTGVLIEDFDLVVPRADPAFMSAEDKSSLATLRRWSSDRTVLATDNLVIFVCAQLSEVSPTLLASPQLGVFHIPFPDLETRKSFLDVEARWITTHNLPDGRLPQITAGLSLQQIRSIIQVSRQTGAPISFEAVSAKKKAIIEKECSGLVELVTPRHDLSHVGGLDAVKAELERVADAVKNGRTNQVPMGMIFVGAMGTGKTFVAEAFAASSGLTCLTLKSFRDKWVGSTEANLEKVLDLVEALGYVLLIVDEADRALAGGDGDDGVGSRVIARLKEFMSDTSHRGRVVTLMMTNRPDKLDVDLKRPGRFDLKIPFFFPETAPERISILAALMRKNRIAVEDGVLNLEGIAQATQGWSGAELESVLLSATARAGREGRVAITQHDIDASVRDVIPSRDVRMLEYMEMLAVFECSNRNMLPGRHVGLSTDQVHAKLDELKVLLGRRAA